MEVRPETQEAGLDLFAIAWNGMRAEIVDVRYPDELEASLREVIASWGADDLFDLTRDGNAVTLERIDGLPTGGIDAG
jgi:hypothetical protein